MSWYTAVLKKYAVFEGRARRKEYWIFFLFNLIIGVVLGILRAVTGSDGVFFFVLSIIYGLAVLVPSIAVGVRRLHDTNRSGLWILIGLVPIVGIIILIIYFATAGTNGPNKYGPDPKGTETLAPAAGT